MSNSNSDLRDIRKKSEVTSKLTSFALVLSRVSRKIKNREGRWESVITSDEKAKEVIERMEYIRAKLFQKARGTKVSSDAQGLETRLPIIVHERFLDALETWARVGEFGERRLREVTNDIRELIKIRLINRS